MSALRTALLAAWRADADVAPIDEAGNVGDPVRVVIDRSELEATTPR